MQRGYKGYQGLSVLNRRSSGPLRKETNMTDVMRQRVLLAGDYGTGKTAWLIQQAIRNPDQPCFIFDTQDKVARVASLFGGVPRNLTVGFTPDAKSMNAFQRDIVKPVIENQPAGYGIVMIDMVDEVWAEMQEFMADLLAESSTGDPNGIGSNLDQQRAALIKQGKDASTGGFDGFQGQWQNIRGWYNFVVRDNLLKMRPHVFITAPLRPLKEAANDKGKANPKKDKDDIIAVWSAFGAAPQSEKNLTGWMDTCLGVEVFDAGLTRQYKLSILKDVTPDASMFTQRLKIDAGKMVAGKDNEQLDFWKVYCDAVGYAPYLLPNPIQPKSKKEKTDA